MTVISNPSFQTFFISVKITVVMTKLVVAWSTEFSAGCVVVMFITQHADLVLDGRRFTSVVDCLPIWPRQNDARQTVALDQQFCKRACAVCMVQTIETIFIDC